MSPTKPAHYKHSSYREMIVEHLMLSELLTLAWAQDRIIEVSRAETDQYGYDLVLTEGVITRHVQVKASVKGGKAGKQTLNLSLLSKPSPCVVWVVVSDDDENGLARDHYRFLGGAPGLPMPNVGDMPAKDPKTKKLREGHRQVRSSAFTRASTPLELLTLLFGRSSAAEND